MNKVNSINPATGKINCSIRLHSKKEALKICETVSIAFSDWKGLSIQKRAEYMHKLAAVLRNKKEEYGMLITKEMGKVLPQSIAEIEKCALTADLFADVSSEWLKDETVNIEGKRAIITFEPVGEVLAIMPWNFPFWQALRCAIPAMMAGNVVVLRHSNLVPMCALAIEEVFKLAGFPQNVFKTVVTDHATVDELIRNKSVTAVSVTGSVETGRTVARIAGGSLKKVVLELGGSDPFIVLNDADINFACKNAVDARLISNGQSCICAKRFIVTKNIATEFTQKLVDMTKSLTVGNPADNSTVVGPLASKQQLLTITKQVNDAKRKGAKVLCGGKSIESPGFFFEPTVITGIKNGMSVAHQEIFGPVSVILIAEDEKDAISIANNSDFGLGASVWTKDIANGEKIARRMDSGLVYVNEIVKSDPRLPFGGIKISGIGRELSRYGLLEFVNIKSIVTPA